jgi:phage terminase large subunit
MSVAQLNRQITKLERSTGREAVKIRPVFQPVEETGEVSGYSDIEGNEIEPRGEDAVLTIHGGIFRELIKPQKYIVLSGGRGSARSHSVARYLLGLALLEPSRFLMTREIQSSLAQSVHYLLRSIIDQTPGLPGFFTVQNEGIFGKNGSEFLFRGIRDFTADSIKSFEDLKFAWIEEAQSLSRRSLDVLLPTIRAEGARAFFTINPTRSTDPVYSDFIDCEEPREDAAVSHWTIGLNSLVSNSLKEEAEYLRKRDPERYQHVYLGGLELYSESRIFNNFVIKQVSIKEVVEELRQAVRFRRDRKIEDARKLYLHKISRVENDFYIGGDFGFTDPSVAVLTYADIENKRLFILDEVFETGLSPDGVAQLFLKLPRVRDRWPVYCDNSRPGLIQHLKGRGINAVAGEKLDLQTRIDGLKLWSIFIDPKCEKVIEEFGLYSWKTDRQGTILPVPKDKNNHSIDAVFYGLGKLLLPKPEAGYKKLKNPYL